MALRVLPDAIGPVRSYLLSVPEVTAITDRIVVELPEDPVWPTVRITVISDTSVFDHWFDRVHMQFDCFDSDPVESNRLARTVRAAMVDSKNAVHAGAVLGGMRNGTMFPSADESHTPLVYRWLVTGNVFIHPTQE